MEGCSTHRLARILAGSDPADRVRAVRELAVREALSSVQRRELLSDPVPALRREACRGASPDQLRPLATDPVWTVRVARAVALKVHGIDELPSLPRVDLDGQPRSPERALAMGLGDPEGELRLVQEDAATLWGRAPDDRAALEALGALGRPQDHERLMGLEPSLGKRGRNAWLLALGRAGDPRALPVLLGALGRSAVDPARGFADRRLAALGLGRMGLPSLDKSLVRAFHAETAHEGTPGAGLGIQYPVKALILWALGECQATSARELVRRCVEDRTGNALGGLRLVALGALAKLG